jgi:hypothetical protein
MKCKRGQNVEVKVTSLKLEGQNGTIRKHGVKHCKFSQIKILKQNNFFKFKQMHTYYIIYKTTEIST